MLLALLSWSEWVYFLGKILLTSILFPLFNRRCTGNLYEFTNFEYLHSVSIFISLISTGSFLGIFSNYFGTHPFNVKSVILLRFRIVFFVKVTQLWDFLHFYHLSYLCPWQNARNMLNWRVKKQKLLLSFCSNLK